MTGDGDPVEGPRPEGAPDEMPAKDQRALPGGDEPAEGRRDVGVDPADLTIAFTPKQIIGGFALLAALVMLLRRRRRD
jgi:MYXO-CTERM domain-containing protein